MRVCLNWLAAISFIDFIDCRNGASNQRQEINNEIERLIQFNTIPFQFKLNSVYLLLKFEFSRQNGIQTNKLNLNGLNGMVYEH